jgi:hypothetical protein
MQSSNDSEKQMRLNATLIELAKKNISPIAPPNSGPEKSHLDIAFSMLPHAQYKMFKLKVKRFSCITFPKGNNL